MRTSVERRTAEPRRPRTDGFTQTIRAIGSTSVWVRMTTGTRAGTAQGKRNAAQAHSNLSRIEKSADTAS
ncbi:hypothetical protein [Bordetella trematum]|uniref:hypothetical protein n=1 Tax=Bordetella trematum TaxID=123899 RepID=UPI0015C53E6E|nr:hypothetical protein [Bordetella trematum]